MKKKKEITNINQETGVTPNQLFEQCHYLVQAIPASFTQTEEEINTAVNDTVLYVFNQMKKGKVPNKDYKDFKNYLFLSLKTNLLHTFQHKKTHRTKFNNGFHDIEIINPNDVIVEDDLQIHDNPEIKMQVETLGEIFKLLTPLEKKMLQEYIDGATITEIAKKYGKSKSWYYILEKKLKNKVISRKNNNVEQKRKYKELMSNQPSKAIKNWNPSSTMKVEAFLNLNEDEQIKYLYKLGYPIRKIGYTLNLKYNRVYNVIIRLGLAKKQRKMDRNKYYSQTDIITRFKITPKELKQLIIYHNIPVIEKQISFGVYSVTAIYIVKEDIERLQLPIKQPKRYKPRVKP